MSQISHCHPAKQVSEPGFQPITEHCVFHILFGHRCLRFWDTIGHNEACLSMSEEENHHTTILPHGILSATLTPTVPVTVNP